MPDVPILLRNKIGVLRSAFLGIRLFKVGVSDVDAVKQTREWSPKTARLGRRDCLPDLDIVGALPSAAIRRPRFSCR